MVHKAKVNGRTSMDVARDTSVQHLTQDLRDHSKFDLLLWVVRALFAVFGFQGNEALAKTRAGCCVEARVQDRLLHQTETDWGLKKCETFGPLDITLLDSKFAPTLDALY